MKYRAVKSFSGKESMRRGEIKAITDKNVVADLLRAGFIEEIKKTKEAKKDGEDDS